MAQWANLISQDDMITRGRIGLKGRLSRIRTSVLTCNTILFPHKRKKNKKEGKTKEKA